MGARRQKQCPAAKIELKSLMEKDLADFNPWKDPQNFVDKYEHIKSLAIARISHYSSITKEQVSRELARRKALSELMVNLETRAAAQQIDTTNAESFKENAEKIKEIAVGLALKRDDLAEVDVRRSISRQARALVKAAKEQARMVKQQAHQTRRLAGASLPAMSPLSLTLLSVGVFLGGFLCFRCFRKRRRAGALPRYNDEKSI